MLSKQHKIFKDQGLGYFHHSIQVGIHPIPDDAFIVKEPSQPGVDNKIIKLTNNKETVVGLTTNSGSLNRRMGTNTEVSRNKWELYKSHDSKGEHWKYKSNNDNFDKKRDDLLLM